MTLRTRLIVAFLLLSVAPLAAVTWWSYRSSVNALQEAAAREADLLAGELSQRMQLVTAQISERVEHLMDVSEPAPPVQTATVTPAEPKPAAPAPVPAPPAEPDDKQLGLQVADALGEAALLLNTVEMPNSRGRGRVGAGGVGTGRGGATAAPGTASGSSSGSRTNSSAPRVSAAPPPSPERPPRTGANTPGPPPVAPRPPIAPGMPAASVPVPGQPPASIVTVVPGPGGDANSIKIDMSGLWRDLYRQIVPPGQTGDLTPEQRQRLSREVNQRMLGIREGIRQSAAVLQRKADEARQKAEADQKAAEQAGAQAARATGAGSKAPAPAPTSPPAASQPAVRPPVTRKSTLTGTKINVSMMQDGKEVRHVNAEINLENVLSTVFSAVGRSQGEVPFAVGTDGHVYTPTEDDRVKVTRLGAVARPNGPIGRTVLPDWIVVTTADPSGSGLRFGIARPVGDSLSALRRTASLNAGIGLAFIGLAIVGIVPLSSRLTRNLSRLTDGVTRIAHGDYAARVPISAKDEMGTLARAFNQMAQDVEDHQRAVVGQERIKRELELGRQIQHDMLPHEPLRFGLSEIQGVSVPAREVGGDFFNYFALPTGHIALLVGDVSGKGVGAALLMANIQASLRTRFALGQDLSAIATEIDYDIEANSPGPMYATLFLGILDPNSRRLRFVNAGHHPQFVLRAGGGLESMGATGIPVGLLAGRGYTEQAVPLQPGDVLFFYTDGCVETENDAGDMFGNDRLNRLLVEASATGATDILQRVERAMDEFRGAHELYDDATMMVVRIG